MIQKDVISKNFKVETKTLKAAKNRNSRSVLIPGIDSLFIVYDLYTRILDNFLCNVKCLNKFYVFSW